MYKLGVIGGLGPAASSFFYNRMIEHTKANCDQEHIDMVILSHASIPDRTKAIETGESKELISLLQKDVSTLEKLGVANIAIPCNTSHYFLDDIQSATKVPIINMIHESVKYAIDANGATRIGIMATDGTIDTGLYHKECEKMGIEAVSPSPKRQRDVMHLIYEEIKCGKTGNVDRFNGVTYELKEMGCDSIILACTELSVFKEYHEIPDICVDAMDILIKESIVRSGGTYIY